MKKHLNYSHWVFHADGHFSNQTLYLKIRELTYLNSLHFGVHTKDLISTHKNSFTNYKIVVVDRTLSPMSKPTFWSSLRLLYRKILQTRMKNKWNVTNTSSTGRKLRH